MKVLIILLVLLMATPSYAVEIEFARGIQDVKKGATIRKNVFATGTMRGLEDVTFIGVAFNRPDPHTEVFIDCKNLTFIKCNLMNVELQEDFTVKSSLVLHKIQYEENGEIFEKLEYKTGKTKIFRIDTNEIDVVSQQYPTLTKEKKTELRKLIPNEFEEVKTLINTEDTPNEKKIKIKYANPNTGAITSIGVSAIE